MRDDCSDDPIDRLREWEDHMYNSGYWVNRFTPFDRPKPSRGFWILALIDVFIAAPTAVALTYYFFTGGDPYFAFPLALVIAVAAIAVLRERRLRPRGSERPQADIERHNREDKQGSKKHPKRRKDYR